MSDEGPIKAWGIDEKTDAAVPTSTERKMKGKYKPSGYMPTSEESLQKEKEVLTPGGDPLDEHFAAINAALERGHKFKSGHKEISAKILQTDLSVEEKGWQGEISQSIHKRPLYQCYNGWWRLCNDNALAQAPHFDVAWSQAMEFDPMMANCDECATQFTQKKFGEKFCGQRCGAKADKKKLDAMIAARPRDNPQLVVGE